MASGRTSLPDDRYNEGMTKLVEVLKEDRGMTDEEVKEYVDKVTTDRIGRTNDMYDADVYW